MRTTEYKYSIQVQSKDMTRRALYRKSNRAGPLSRKILWQSKFNEQFINESLRKRAGQLQSCYVTYSQTPTQCPRNMKTTQNNFKNKLISGSHYQSQLCAKMVELCVGENQILNTCLLGKIETWFIMMPSANKSLIYIATCIITALLELIWKVYSSCRIQCV